MAACREMWPEVVEEEDICATDRGRLSTAANGS